MFICAKLIPVMGVLEWMPMVNGSIASAKSRGELGQPYLHPLDNEKVIGTMSFVKILALGA